MSVLYAYLVIERICLNQFTILLRIHWVLFYTIEPHNQNHTSACRIIPNQVTLSTPIEKTHTHEGKEIHHELPLPQMPEFYPHFA